MNKACPLVIRKNKEQYEFLAFEHPLAGNQIVKGTIESGESLEAACERELFEESGLVGKVVSNLGCWDAKFEGQVWGFCEIELDSTPAERWEHYCLDDNGHTFRFYWHALDSQLDENWHPLFKGAIEYVKSAITNTGTRLVNSRVL